MLQDAKWIKSPVNEEEKCYEFYTSVTIDKKVKKAVLCVSAIGLYSAFINGNRVGNEILTPYFTEYSKRVQYQTYDVTEMLYKNFELSFICAEGWAIGRTWGRDNYGKNISLIYSLDIVFEDDSKISYISDEQTNVRTSYIISSAIYDGETTDMSKERIYIGKALIDSEVNTQLIPTIGNKVTEHEILSAQEVIITPKGETVIDFGQNLSGYVKITLSGKKGDVIELSHAEVLDKDGNFYTGNLRSAKQKNTYIMSGNGLETFHPLFTWQGFRYVRIDKFPYDKIDTDCIKAVVIHSDIKPISSFVCGNSKINQLYHNVIWGQKSNFIDIPTDCPQRDERMGWTGDAQVFARTAAINYDVERFFEKWLGDLALVQREDGAVTVVTPSVNTEGRISAGWADAAVICPWEIYMAYGNEKLLSAQFESMKKWIDYMHNFGEEEFLWLGGNHYGDWLATDAEDGSYIGATSKDYIASAYFAYSTSLFIKAGSVLEKDMSKYEDLYKNIISSFQERFTKNGVPVVETQTAYALALHFNLCENKKETAAKLNDMIRKNGTRLNTGFIGTPYLLYALSDNGYIQTAFDLLFCEELPSWLYQINHDATTIWEHWDGVKEDGSFWSDDMNSFNHYAYGAVYSWIFEVASGIRRNPDGAGYSNVTLNPHPDRRLNFQKTEIETKFGKLSVHWYYDMNENIRFQFEVPYGISAKIILPDGRTDNVSDGVFCYTVKEDNICCNV